MERLGSARTIKVDVRVIAATNKDLEGEIESGRFREDLYFRLSVIPIRVAPLRERLEDIPGLVTHFVSQFSRENNRRQARFSPQAIEALQQARWRGNIRELKNVVERLLIMVPRDVIEASDVRSVVRTGGAGPVVSDTGETLPLETGPSPASGSANVPAAATLREFKEATERAWLVAKLREQAWNISKTAEVIDTPRSNLYKKLEQYGISQETDG